MRVNLTAPPPPIFPFFFLWLFCFQIIASGVCPAFSSEEAAAAAIAFRKHDEGKPNPRRLNNWFGERRLPFARDLCLFQVRGRLGGPAWAGAPTERKKGLSQIVISILSRSCRRGFFGGKGSIRARDCAASGSAGFKRGRSRRKERYIGGARGKLRGKMGGIESIDFLLSIIVFQGVTSRKSLDENAD